MREGSWNALMVLCSPLLSLTQSASGALAMTLKCSAQICAVGPQTCHPTQSYAIAPTAGHILVA